MSTDKEKGITWQLQAKQLAAIELSQRTKLVADQLDERLFEKVSVYTIPQIKPITCNLHIKTDISCIYMYNNNIISTIVLYW